MGTVVAFGRWPSPLSPAAVAAARRSRAALSSDGTYLYWSESRPQEGGRTVVVRARDAGEPDEVSPPGTSVRSRVHEYGGGAYCLVPPTGGGGIAYVDQADQRVWRTVPSGSGGAGGAPRPLTPDPPAGERWHHGDLRATGDGRWVLAVRERHHERGVTRDVVALPVAGSPAPAQAPPTVLCSGRDFFAAPRPDRSGRRLAWVCWDHPDMPWDASELWVGDLALPPSGPGGAVPTVGAARRVAGGRGGGQAADGESVGQPLWCDDGSLVFVSDAGGWWQPWRWWEGGRPGRICAEEAEFHGPDWALGQATITELPGGALACRRRRQGTDAVGLLRPGSGHFEVVEQPCVSVTALCAHGDGAAWLGATTATGTAPWWAPAPGTPARAFGPPDVPLLRPVDVSSAGYFGFAGPGGPVHGLYYPPALAGYEGPAGTPPPLVVVCHGGPTGSADAGFDPVVQLFTSRGFAVAAVDYAGSTGYGRAYRQRLVGAWGVADVDDCVAAARHLAETGRADPSRTVVRGASAGGLTALASLARSRAFAAACSWYGVTDLLALVASTHDFESRYNDRLVGPLPGAADEYRRRSPVNRVDDMAGAVLVLQGLDDPVVPPGQAAAMVGALRRRGLGCEYLAFAGESHGFRRAETVRACLEAELALYDDVLRGR